MPLADGTALAKRAGTSDWLCYLWPPACPASTTKTQTTTKAPTSTSATAQKTTAAVDPVVVQSPKTSTQAAPAAAPTTTSPMPPAATSTGKPGDHTTTVDPVLVQPGENGGGNTNTGSDNDSGSGSSSSSSNNNGNGNGNGANDNGSNATPTANHGGAAATGSGGSSQTGAAGSSGSGNSGSSGSSGTGSSQDQPGQSGVASALDPSASTGSTSGGVGGTGGAVSGGTGTGGTSGGGGGTGGTGAGIGGNGGGGLPPGAIAGIVVAFLVLLALVAALLYRFRRRRAVQRLLAPLGLGTRGFDRVDTPGADSMGRNLLSPTPVAGAPAVGGAAAPMSQTGYLHPLVVPVGARQRDHNRVSAFSNDTVAGSGFTPSPTSPHPPMGMLSPAAGQTIRPAHTAADAQVRTPANAHISRGSIGSASTSSAISAALSPGQMAWPMPPGTPPAIRHPDGPQYLNFQQQGQTVVRINQPPRSSRSRSSGNNT